MKTCFYCKRDIQFGTRILVNGIQYVCSGENDINICDATRQTNEQNKKQSEYIKSQELIKQNGGTPVHCSCGTSFYTNFPIEIDPPCDNCPNCGITHVKGFFTT